MCYVLHDYMHYMHVYVRDFDFESPALNASYLEPSLSCGAALTIDPTTGEDRGGGASPLMPADAAENLSARLPEEVRRTSARLPVPATLDAPT